MHEQLHEIPARNKYESSLLKKYSKVQNKLSFHWFFERTKKANGFKNYEKTQVTSKTATILESGPFESLKVFEIQISLCLRTFNFDIIISFSACVFAFLMISLYFHH